MTMHIPIKRQQGLISFSREHHFGLLLVWKIRVGLRNEIAPDRISRYVLFFFRVNLKKHFREEETMLFNRLHDNDLLRKRAEYQHVEICELALKIELNKENRVLLEQFSDKLENHIRLEERELFNHIQYTIPANELAETETRFVINSQVIDDCWEDVFWEFKKK